MFSSVARTAALVGAISAVSACQSNSDALNLQSASRAAPQQLPSPAPAAVPAPVAEVQADDATSTYAAVSPEVAATPSDLVPSTVEVTPPPPSKTYLINGLASAVPFIGYGFANLKEKIPGSKLYSYVSPVEGSTVIAPSIVREIKAQHARNPETQFNIIGISYGANLATRIASRLQRQGISLHYLGIVEGTNLKRIGENVAAADNFTCTYLDCTRAIARLGRDNLTTELNAYKFKTSHIPMGNNVEMHKRVLAQINR